MGHLESITGPQDLRRLDDRQLAELAAEIRDELVRTCAPRGGHLGPNLGVVELTLAIHRVFESPRDKIVFVDPERIAGLDLAGSSRHFLPLFLESDLYATLRSAL